MTLPYILLVLLVVAVMVGIAWWGSRSRTSETSAPAPSPELAARLKAVEAALAAHGKRLEALEDQAPSPDHRHVVPPDPEALERRLRREIEAEVARQVTRAVAKRPVPAPAPAPAVIPSEAPPPEDAGDEARVRALLLAEGFSQPVLLGPGAQEGAWRVEASRQGATHKGVVRLSPGGGGTVHLQHGFRAFP